jgi:hypothetical protein
MTYIVVTAQNGRSHYLAKSRIGGGYTTIATFQNEQMARETAALLNTTELRAVKSNVRKEAA